MYTIRGAVTVEKNQEDDILKAVKELINKIVEVNELNKEDIISFIFSTTDDLDSVYPGKGVRELGYKKTSIMCLQEMFVKDSLDKCIRVMMLINDDKNKEAIRHIYLKEAAKLRADLNYLAEEPNR